MTKIPMTAAGYAKLTEEIKDLKSVQRPANIRALEEARAHGDLSENAEYHAAKEKQSFIEGRVLQVESMISHADVIDVTKLSGDAVTFGATVTVVDEETEKKSRYQIVGDCEADVKEGKVSVSSPIARALIGKGPGDSVEVSTPGGGRAYEIIKVEFS